MTRSGATRPVGNVLGFRTRPWAGALPSRVDYTYESRPWKTVCSPPARGGTPRRSDAQNGVVGKPQIGIPSGWSATFPLLFVDRRWQITVPPRS